MNDPLRDPRFPKRPQHPDFWRLAECAMQNDGLSNEGGEPVPDIVSEFCDPESLTYAAMQRAGMAAAKTGFDQVAAAAGFIDGFLIGVRFAQRGGHQDDPAEGKR